MQPVPLLRINLSAAVPAYQQIADGLRALLVAGEFEPGDQLPTVRQLAMDLGVHHNTVAEAYRRLAGEGWLDLKRRRGAIVVARAGAKSNPKARADFAKRLKELAAKAVTEGVSENAIARELQSLAEAFSKE